MQIFSWNGIFPIDCTGNGIFEKSADLGYWNLGRKKLGYGSLKLEYLGCRNPHPLRVHTCLPGLSKLPKIPRWCRSWVILLDIIIAGFSVLMGLKFHPFIWGRMNGAELRDLTFIIGGGGDWVETFKKLVSFRRPPTLESKFFLDPPPQVKNVP